MSEKKILKLSIFDKQYVVATDEDEHEIYRAAHEVDALLRDISSQIKSNNEGKIAVLAALKFATDLAKQSTSQKRDYDQVQKIVSLFDSTKSSSQ